MTLSAYWLPRLLHPVAWWIWALGLAVTASRTTNPLLLLLIIAITGYVVAARRTPAPWARAFPAFLVLGVVIVVIRVVFQVIFGLDSGAEPLFTLPQLTLPEWAAGMELGGPVSLDGLLWALYDGLRIAAMVICLGAANALANPHRLLRVVPAALYELGVAVVVTITLIPQAIADGQRIRVARRLRGRTTKGLSGAAGVALPVLEGALERSIDLAAAMDSRGYGRRAGVPARDRRLTGVLTLIGVLGVLIGLYGVLDGGTPTVSGVGVLGWPMLALGLTAAAVGLGIAGRRQVRTRYRPDPWTVPEWLVIGCGIVPAGAFIVAAGRGVAGLIGPTHPPAWPSLPWALVAILAVAVLPAVLAPPIPRTVPDQPVPVPDRHPEEVPA